MRRKAGDPGVGRRLVLVTLLVAGLTGLSAPPARSAIWTGACALNVKFSFNSRVKPAAVSLTAPSYSISVSGAVDLDPRTTGMEPCVLSAGLLDPFVTTGVSASGASDIWTCESTLADGPWRQSWDSGFAAVSGDHVITGSWGGWEMVITNPELNFTGTMELTVHPLDASKLASCLTTGILSLKMVGVMKFQDPEVPAG